MSSVRFTADILPDGTISVPKGVRLAPGKAEVTVDPVEAVGTRSSVRDFAGAFRSNDANSAANERIDADLTRYSGNSRGETE